MKDFEIDVTKKEFMNHVNKVEIENPRIQTKFYHSLRVMENCKKIATGLNLTEEQIQLAQLIGLLHDIGRFEQYKIPNKNVKFDHGKAGMELLKKDNYIRKYIKDDRYDNIIFTAICEHNKYELNKDLSQEEELFCKIVKDADKIDIIYEGVYIYWQEKEQIKQVEEGELSSKMIEDFYACKLLKKENASSEIDQILKLVSYIYDINFKCSFEILKENGNVIKLLDRFDYKLPKTKMEIIKVKDFVNKYIEGKIK